MIKEFRDFIMRGNVLELAVAVIIGAAFGAVVTSFTQDIIMPPIGLALGDVDFTNLAMVLKPAVVEGDTVVEEAVAIRYGQWLKTVVDFLIIGFVLFMIIRTYNKMNPPPEPAPKGPSTEQLLVEIRDLLARK